MTIATVDGTGSSTPLTTFTGEFEVHPEPGKPTRFLSPFEVTGATDDHLYEFWANYLVTTVGSVTSSGPYRKYNSFYLVDRWNNVTFGYTGTQTVSTPQNINVSFTSQLAGSSVPDVSYPGYETDVSWSNIGGAMPSGTYGLSLALNFTDAQYGSGTVTEPITLSFISGTYSALVSQQDYDLRFGVDDTSWPVTVSPAATGSALPATSDPRSGQPSIPKRLCFQIVTGTNVPLTGEIYENPHNVYDALGNYVRTDTNQDPHLETSEPGRMKLSVVDGTDTPMTDIAFQVHNCPHYDHEGSPRQPTDMTNARACADTPVQSAGGVIATYSVNPAGSSRGYMGIELLRAPTNPGTYYIRIESLDQIYRIEQLPGLTVDPTPSGEFKGAFGLCVVTAGEILDQNFQRVTEPTVTQETQFYFRLLESSSSLPVSQTVTLSAVEGGDADPNPIDITAGRVGSSSSYIGPFVLYPDAFDTVITQGIRQSAAQTAGPQKKVKAGPRRLKGTRQNQVVANVPQNTPFELALDIDTTVTGRKPNLLLADGQDNTQVRATLVTPQGKPFYAPTSVDLKVGAGQGQVLNLTPAPGPLSIYDFQYQAPSMPLDLTDPSVYRPVFYGTIGGSTIALPYRDGGYTLKFHWPMYYRGHNFKNMLEDFEYVSSGTKLPDEAAVQAFLSAVPTDTGTTVISFLKDFYFVNMPDPPPGSTTYPPATSPVHGFVDLNGNGEYDVGEPVYCANGSGCSLSSITSVNRFSHVLFDMSQRFDLSAANMLTTLQKEYHFAEKGSKMPSASGSAAALDAAMGCFVGPPANPSFVGLIRQLVCGASTLHNRYVAPENQRIDFFPAPSSVVDGNTPQIVAVCSDVGSQRVAAGYQSLNKASRAQAVYTNTVVNCVQAGTYSFSYWWHYFFGGPP